MEKWKKCSKNHNKKKKQKKSKKGGVIPAKGRKELEQRKREGSSKMGGKREKLGEEAQRGLRRRCPRAAEIPDFGAFFGVFPPSFPAAAGAGAAGQAFAQETWCQVWKISSLGLIFLGGFFEKGEKFARFGCSQPYPRPAAELPRPRHCSLLKTAKIGKKGLKKKPKPTSFSCGGEGGVGFPLGKWGKNVISPQIRAERPGRC